MNNDTAGATFINSVVTIEYVQNVYVAELALLVYTTVLAMPQEMEYVWLSPRPLSIPNLLYAFTRYGSLISQWLSFWLSAFATQESLCNNLVNVENAASVVGFAGVQGLLVARAYSLCGGNKIIAGILAFLFLGGLILNICRPIIYSGCVSYTGVRYFSISLVLNILAILTDLVVFCVSLWKVWGTWKLKRDTGIRSNNDLVSVLLKQTVLRFCFVIVFTVTFTIIVEFLDSFIVDILSGFQRCLSAILIADCTLDLRQQNSAAIRAMNKTLPTIQFQDAVDYIHQSILVEMGTPENTDTREGDDEEISEFPDIENRHEESL